MIIHMKEHPPEGRVANVAEYFVEKTVNHYSALDVTHVGLTCGAAYPLLLPFQCIKTTIGRFSESSIVFVFLDPSI